jgi:hypothetical protein
VQPWERNAPQRELLRPGPRDGLPGGIRQATSHSARAGKLSSLPEQGFSNTQGEKARVRGHGRGRWRWRTVSDAMELTASTHSAAESFGSHT